MKRYSCLIILTLLYIARATDVSRAIAQNTKADSLLARFENGHSLATANELFDLFADDGLTDEHIRLTEKTHPDTVCQQVWYWAAEYFNAHQQYEKAESYGLKALPLCEVGNNRTVEGDCLMTLAISQFRQGDFQKAVGYAKRCNELDRKAGDPANIASSLNLLAAIFVASYQHEEAEQCVLEGLKYAETDGNQARLAILNGMACEIYFYQKDYQQALQYGQRALAIEQQSGNKVKMAMRQSQIAGALIGLKRIDEARQLLNEAIPLLQEGNLHSCAIACNQMGDILLTENRNDEAATYYNKALKVFTDQKDKYNESHSHHGLYMALRKSNPTLAMEHNDRYIALRDTIYSQRTSALVSRYAALAGNVRLQAEKAELSRLHRINIMIGIGVGLLVLMVIGMAARWRIRRERRHIAQLSQRIAQLTLQAQNIAAPQQDELEDSTLCTEESDGELNEGGEKEFLFSLIEVVNHLLDKGELSVEQVALGLNMSTATLRRRLMQTVGESPKAYFTAIQMQKATSLLATTNLSVAEIARRCGFQEASNFTRAFKRVYGISPLQYMKRE